MSEESYISCWCGRPDEYDNMIECTGFHGGVSRWVHQRCTEPAVKNYPLPADGKSSLTVLYVCLLIEVLEPYYCKDCLAQATFWLKKFPQGIHDKLPRGLAKLAPRPEPFTGPRALDDEWSSMDKNRSFGHIVNEGYTLNELGGFGFFPDGLDMPDFNETEDDQSSSKKQDAPGSSEKQDLKGPNVPRLGKELTPNEPDYSDSEDADKTKPPESKKNPTIDERQSPDSSEWTDTDWTDDESNGNLDSDTEPFDNEPESLGTDRGSGDEEPNSPNTGKGSGDDEPDLSDPKNESDDTGELTPDQSSSDNDSDYDDGPPAGGRKLANSVAATTRAHLTSTRVSPPHELAPPPPCSTGGWTPGPRGPSPAATTPAPASKGKTASRKRKAPTPSSDEEEEEGEEEDPEAKKRKKDLRWTEPEYQYLGRRVREMVEEGNRGEGIFDEIFEEDGFQPGRTAGSLKNKYNRKGREFFGVDERLVQKEGAPPRKISTGVRSPDAKKKKKKKKKNKKKKKKGKKGKKQRSLSPDVDEPEPSNIKWRRRDDDDGSDQEDDSYRPSNAQGPSKGMRGVAAAW